MEIILWFDMQAGDTMSKIRSKKNVSNISLFKKMVCICFHEKLQMFFFLSSNDAQLYFIYI